MGPSARTAVTSRAETLSRRSGRVRCMEKLPEGHKMVNTRHGAPIVRRSDGQLFRVQPTAAWRRPSVSRASSPTWTSTASFWWGIGTSRCTRRETRVGAVDDDAIRALVTRLARPHPSGGDVIERAAILAEGADLAAVVAWITAHAGIPEARVTAAPRHGLHGRLNDSGGAQPRTPLRYLLPAGALA